jgi:hypothetical protein
MKVMPAAEVAGFVLSRAEYAAGDEKESVCAPPGEMMKKSYADAFQCRGAVRASAVHFRVAPRVADRSRRCRPLSDVRRAAGQAQIQAIN